MLEYSDFSQTRVNLTSSVLIRNGVAEKNIEFNKKKISYRVSLGLFGGV